MVLATRRSLRNRCRHWQPKRIVNATIWPVTMGEDEWEGSTSDLLVVDVALLHRRQFPCWPAKPMGVAWPSGQNSVRPIVAVRSQDFVSLGEVWQTVDLRCP